MRLGPSARLYCPYCYEEISAREIWFRCAGRTSRSGRRCAAQADPVLRARTGSTEALPPGFPGDGRQNSAPCPDCGDETTVRICPVCHSRLPVHFGKVPSRLIVPVGAKEAGKTVFMTVLVHELMHQTGQRLNAAITGADDSTRERFTRDYEQPMYRGGKLLAPTTTAAGTPHRAPLVFRFTTEGHHARTAAGPLGTRGGLGGLGRPGRGEPQRTLLSFFDTAGEDLRSARSMEQNVHYLGAADGILLLLDPLQMPGARGLAAADTRLPTPGTTDDEPANVLESVTDLIMAAQVKRPNDRISKPLAIVFTKMDALMGDLKDTSPLLRPPPQTAYFDDRDSLEVHTEIQRLLARWNGSRIDQIARHNYRHYRYFGVSALGESPTADNRVSGRGIRPYRVTSPILWILAQFGIIGVK